MESHKCEAIVVSCIDFRIQKYVEELAKVRFGERNYDRLAWAGGVKDIRGVVDQIRLSRKLHHIKQVLLINHEECGAYGEDGSYEDHRQDLIKIKEIVLKEMAEIEVWLYYLKLNGLFEELPS